MKKFTSALGDWVPALLMAVSCSIALYILVTATP